MAPPFSTVFGADRTTCAYPVNFYRDDPGTGPLACKPGHRPIDMQTWAQAHWHANLGTGPLTGSGKAGASPASTCRTLQRLQCRGGAGPRPAGPRLAGPRLAGPRLAGPRFAAPALPVLACI